MTDHLPSTDNDDAEAERLERYADELADERTERHRDKFREADRRDRTGPNYG